MAPPTPLLLTLTAAGLCVLKAIFLPELYPDTKLTTLYLTLASAVFFAYYGLWRTVIYPKFASPLRHLPQPKVQYPKSMIIPKKSCKKILTGK